MILMDQEFYKLEGTIENIDGDIGNVEINTRASREHVAETERSIRTDKERARAIRPLLPLLVLPKQVVIHLVYYVIIFLNCEICQNGISATMLPREIVLRRCLDWLKHCRSAGVPLEFG